jgi:hypothetical protein
MLPLWVSGYLINKMVHVFNKSTQDIYLVLGIIYYYLLLLLLIIIIIIYYYYLYYYYL